MSGNISAEIEYTEAGVADNTSFNEPRTVADDR
jgi:hypothetical protein